MPVVVELLGATAWPRWRALRLQALESDPEAFCSSLEQVRDRTDASWQEQLASRTAHWVATLDGGDAGMTAAASSAENPAALELVSVWVAPQARGCGVGDALVTAALDFGRGTGYDAVQLWVRAANERAHRLYGRHGFVPTGAVSEEHGAPEVLLWRDLRG